MRTLAVGLVGACFGASALWLFQVSTSDQETARQSTVSEGAAHALHSNSKGSSDPSADRAYAAHPSTSSEVVLIPAQPSQAPPESEERATLARYAANVFTRGAKWEAEHGEKPDAAKAVVRRMKAFDKLLEGEPDHAWHQKVTGNLDRILSNSDSHVASSECSKLACRVELLHENDVAAVEFTPERLQAASPGNFVDALVDRSDEDGQLHTYVYYRKPEALPEGHLQAAAEILRQQEILANVDDK